MLLFVTVYEPCNILRLRINSISAEDYFLFRCIYVWCLCIFYVYFFNAQVSGYSIKTIVDLLIKTKSYYYFSFTFTPAFIPTKTQNISLLNNWTCQRAVQIMEKIFYIWPFDHTKYNVRIWPINVIENLAKTNINTLCAMPSMT